MRPDQVSNPGPLTYESGVLPTALRGPALITEGCHRVKRLPSIDLRCDHPHDHLDHTSAVWSMARLFKTNDVVS